MDRVDSSFAEKEFELGVVFVGRLFSLFDCLKGFHCVFLASRVGEASFQASLEGIPSTSKIFSFLTINIGILPNFCNSVVH